MLKTIRKIMKYVAYSLLGLFVAMILWVTTLYLSADMLSPDYAPQEAYQVIQTDSLRQYGHNFLRQSNSGLWELKVSGNARQRGEAIGKLSADLLYYQEKVFVDQIREIVPSDNYLKFLRFFIVLFNRNLGKNIPQEYRDEIYGISLSCTHEYDFIGTPYERQLNYHSAHDLGHAMQDYMLVGCSSFAVWGENSADSSLIVGRNFDFYMGDKFAQNKLVSFYQPEHGYKFASIGWPGMIGVLSGMNETGLTVTINAAKSTMPTASATPISILSREILQYASTIDEAYAIARQRNTFVSESILISTRNGKAAIIEKSPEKTALFIGTDHQVVCTNHYQSEAFSQDERNQENIATSDSPHRFTRLQELLAQNSPITPQRAADILRNRQGLNQTELGMGNEMAINQLIAHHSVIFQPKKLLMYVSTSPWQCGKYMAYDLNKIFSDTLDFHREIATQELTIPEDSFLHRKEFRQFMLYKRLGKVISQKIARQETIEEQVLTFYEASNPSFYHVQEVLGDYYASVRQPRKAVSHWRKALTMPIPKQAERIHIEQKIKKNQPQ